MAVACSEMITVPAGRFRAGELAALVPPSGWQRRSCADGSKGPRLYDWALIGTASPAHQLLARRSLAPGEKGELELAFFRCWSPRPSVGSFVPAHLSPGSVIVQGHPASGCSNLSGRPALSTTSVVVLGRC
jgi:hypothetical protein